VEQNIAFGLKNSRQAGRSADFGSDKTPGMPRRISSLLKGNSLKKHQIHNRVRELSALFKINDLLDRKPDSLSGGEKQRVALARALITDPGILLLDEPLGSLDPETRETIQTELRRIQQKLGITTLHITHNFEVAVALADRIGVIIGGKLLQTGTGREVFRQPINEEVARFVGVRNIFRGQHIVEGDGCGYLKLDGIEFASISKLEGSVRASIRPEDILLSKQSLQSSARNNFPGIITQISERGPFNYVTVQLATRKNSKELDLVVMITQNSAAEFAFELGQEVQIAFKASALHIF
jgi:molybdate/tungstate transport system ATP-binding protein